MSVWVDACIFYVDDADSYTAFEQHDVQELCRVLFEALETKFKNTDQANAIETFYQGTLKDYVKCKTVP